MNKTSATLKKQLNKVVKLYNRSSFQAAKKEALTLLKLDDKNIELLKNLIMIEDSLIEPDIEKKIEYLLQLLKVDSNNYEVYLTLATAYNTKNEYFKAEDILLKMLALFPKNLMTYDQLGSFYSEHGNYEDAKKIFKKGMSLYPNSADLAYLYSTVCLRFYDYKEGFSYYRYRYHEKRTNRTTTLLFPGKVLEPDTDIKDKVILCTDDQGYGDMIQFMRYLPLFEEKGAKVYFKVHKLLHRLFAKNYPKYIIDTKDLKIDYHLPMIDAAYIFGTEYSTIPFQEKYLEVDPKDSLAIYNRYFRDVRKKKVGIVWRSNSREEDSAAKRSLRQDGSSTLEDFLYYLNTDEVQLYSLQHMATDEEKEILKQHNVLSLGDDFIDFYDNALRIDNLDAVIGIETASILIAGAMGKETVVLLKHNPYWIWGASGTSTNWFKSIRIVRKETREDWTDKLEYISNLNGLLKNINNIEVIMQQAIKYHKQGALAEAEELYKRVLEQEPENAEAYHYLGLIAFQTRHLEQALLLIKKAFELNPYLDGVYANLEKVVALLQQQNNK